MTKLKINLQVELLEMEYTPEGFIMIHMKWLNPEHKRQWSSWMLEEMLECLLNDEERQKLEAFVKEQKEKINATQNVDAKS